MASDTSSGMMTGGVTGAIGIAMLGVALLANPTRKWRVQGMDPPPVWAVPLLITSIVVIIAGAIVFAIALNRSRRKPAPGTADISAEVQAHRLPFSVCSHCRLLIDLPHAFACPRCDSAATTMRVETDVDRSTAIASLGPAPGAQGDRLAWLMAQPRPRRSRRTS